MPGFDPTRNPLLRRARWTAAGLLAMLVLFVLLVDLGVRVNASLPLIRQPQSEGTPAPSTPIRPVSVSVINFAELAAQDAKAGKELQTNASAMIRALPPPREITELDAKSERPTTAASGRSDLVQPLISSPAPSQSFLAQEDAPEVGTGTFAIPPDTTGAVGIDKLFVTVNNNYRVQNKTTGAALSTVSINAFWSSTGAARVFDPRVQYDPYNNRWIVAAISNGATADSSILVGISASSDPQGTFTLFRFVVGCAAGAMNCDANGETADFPMLGFNKNWVAISWNQFQIGGSNSFVAGKMLAIDYPSLQSGTSNSTVFTVTTANNPAAFCMHPATTLSATEDALYVPAHLSSAGAIYRLHKITGTPGTPVYMLDTISRTRTGGGWAQPGGDLLPQTCVGTPGTTCPTTPRTIESTDAFIRSNVVFRNGNVWYAQTIALPAGGLGQSNTHTAAQWTRIDASGNFVDGGRVEDPTATGTNGGEWYAYASVAVNVNNDALLGFSSFASSHFARAGYSLRLGTDTAGTMRDPVIFKDGEDYYAKDFGGSRNRWGDYSHSLVDPANDLDLWTIQEYAGTRVVKDSQQTTNSSRWGTWWAKVPPSGPAPSPTPTPTPTPTPAPCTTALIVNNNGDASDAAPGDSFCATAGGVCTLRAAIEEANARTACATIDINFSGVPSPISLGAALPALNHNVNIVGPGANQLTVQRSTAGGTPDFRVFTINSGKTVMILGLTISNGKMTGGDCTTNVNDGAGINNSGTLTITNGNLFGNMSRCGRGGAIFSNGPSLTLNSCNIGGTAFGQANTGGGGIFSGSSLTMSGGSVVGNSGVGLTLANGTNTLNGVAITDNAGVAFDSGGLETWAFGTTKIINSLIANNTAVRNGGGIYNQGTLTVVNSTISGNKSGGAGAGIDGTFETSTTLYNVTVTNNRADSDNSGGERGGGIHTGRNQVTLRNSILAGNFRGASPSMISDDLDANAGAVPPSSYSFSVIGTCTGCGLTNGTNNNQVGVNDPKLGPLANNGGPTLTHALLPGSPAINAGSNSFITNPPFNGPPFTDQRGAGFDRNVNGTVDIGAFEVQGPPPTVQFGAPSFSVNEGDKQVLFTVARVSGGAGPFTVNFTTSDTAGAQNCNVLNGKASSRCDYISAIGTLSFGAGENLKIISILIIDDTYAEGPETFAVNLSNPMGATLSAQSTATVTINDNDTVTGTNPIDQSGFFVRQHYLDFLNREPDTSGLNFWTGEIDGCTPKPQCTEIKRINVSAAFYLSIEFQGTGYLVERIYKASYGDASGGSTFGGTHQLPVPIIRFNEFLADTQQIGRGVVVGQTGWEQALENNKQAFTLEFGQRSRFITAFPTTLNPTQFVNMLFTNAGLPQSGPDYTAAINEFGSASNTADMAARSRALRRVAENPTLTQQEFNRAFVLMQFFGYLRRNPNDPQDTDYTGYDFWLTKLNSFTVSGDDPLVRAQKAEMVKAFISSTEYRQRFGP